MSERHHTRGLFGGGYRIRERPYTGPDFTRLCIMFSGQGWAHPGMYRAAFLASPEIRARFGTADNFAADRGIPPPNDGVGEGATKFSKNS